MTKLNSILAGAALVGALTVFGCGDNGGGTGGGGTCDPDVICANCPEGRELNDCRADVRGCDLDPRGCEQCIADTMPECP